MNCKESLPSSYFESESPLLFHFLLRPLSCVLEGSSSLGEFDDCPVNVHTSLQINAGVCCTSVQGLTVLNWFPLPVLGELRAASPSAMFMLGHVTPGTRLPF